MALGVMWALLGVETLVQTPVVGAFIARVYLFPSFEQGRALAGGIGIAQIVTGCAVTLRPVRRVGGLAGAFTACAMLGGAMMTFGRADGLKCGCLTALGVERFGVLNVLVLAAVGVGFVLAAGLQSAPSTSTRRD